ncbi:hypothetical protein [Cohnella sp. GCM10012308]|uniref:hypothetical protein n=1 Tax=Cohnella sp. GCM10012308 TaxID=3317329 RepID=UPI00361E9A22
MKKVRMIMLCANIAISTEVILEMIVGIKQKPLTIALVALNVAMILTLYKEELKELIKKIKGDDDFTGGNFG